MIIIFIWITYKGICLYCQIIVAIIHTIQLLHVIIPKNNWLHMYFVNICPNRLSSSLLNCLNIMTYHCSAHALIINSLLWIWTQRKHLSYKPNVTLLELNLQSLKLSTERLLLWYIKQFFKSSLDIGKLLSEISECISFPSTMHMEKSVFSTWKWMYYLIELSQM